MQTNAEYCNCLNLIYYVSINVTPWPKYCTSSPSVRFTSIFRTLDYFAVTWTHHQRYASAFRTEGSNWSRCKNKLHLRSYLWLRRQTGQYKNPLLFGCSFYSPSVYVEVEIIQEFSNVDTYTATYISFIYHMVHFDSGIKESTHHCYINGAGLPIFSIAVISWGGNTVSTESFHLVVVW